MTAPRVVPPSEEESDNLEKLVVEIVEDDSDGSLVGERPPGTAHIMTSRIGFELLTRLGQTTIERL